MATIRLIRLDYRLIHGQVVTKWVKQANADRIIIVNDALANDEFLGSVYKMAAPSDVRVSIFSIEKAMKRWEKNQFGEGNVLMLFKSVEDARNMQKQGFPMESLQIGGLGGGNGRVNTPCGISFDAKDASLLKEMEADGCEVYIHVVPSQQKFELDKVIDKLDLQ